MALPKISEVVYVGLCHKIGTSQQVAIRRDIMDIDELFDEQTLTTNPNSPASLISGSRREGFRFKTSDTDAMFWMKNHRVLWFRSQAHMYNPNRCALILCDNSDSPPGFTLLCLLGRNAGRDVILACVRINGVFYISSARYRGITCNLITPHSTVHGPCSSGKMGNLEYDDAHCFASDFWPPSASSWIDRCHSWPQPHVVDDIIRSGCHFVAIGHRLGRHVENEWRISFSQAEQKLVYSMNHSQFLTYGLLKLFLKEIINNGLPEEERLLCSYHMKTAIFWAVQQNIIPDWSPQNLLGGFWVCFKLLLKWVYEGVCPNFFIPENNMFLNNIHGEAQMNLFTRLVSLYEKGIAFLLQSPSISSYIIDVLCNPRLSVSTDECTLISEVVVDKELFEEICAVDSLPPRDLRGYMECLNTIHQLIRLPLTQCQVIVLQKLTASLLQKYAFMMHNIYTKTSVANKRVYIADKISCHMLKLAAKFGLVSDLLYLAMYYYKTCRYREALSIIDMTKVKLAQPGLMYRRDVDPRRYTEAVGGQSWSTKMRQAVAQKIQLNNYICYIDELRQEQQSGLQNRVFFPTRSFNKWSVLFIPPLVLSHMLAFLCCRHVDSVRAQAALDDLQVLVHHDQGLLIEPRDISWEILGICQQITGNHQAALDSYQQSLRQYPTNRIHTATRHRIQDLHI